MTAIQAVREVMNLTETSLSELEEYTYLGSASNICQMLGRKDLKVSTFVEMLEAMGYQLIVQSGESDNELIVDYDS